MESHSILRQDKGFTLVEILIAIGILAILGALGLFISFDFYKSYAFSTEKNIAISVLQRVRNQSVNNINETRHGVYFSSSNQYIMFQCPDNAPCDDYADADTSKNIVIEPSYGISITGVPFYIIFDQLNGDCITCPSYPSNTIVGINYESKHYDILINEEGRISW